MLKEKINNNYSISFSSTFIYYLFIAIFINFFIYPLTPSFIHVFNLYCMYLFLHSLAHSFIKYVFFDTFFYLCKGGGGVGGYRRLLVAKNILHLLWFTATIENEWEIYQNVPVITFINL